MKRYWNSRTFWMALSTIVTAMGAVIAAPAEMRLTVAIGSLAACFAAFGTIFAREGGVTAALELSGTVPQTAETVTIVEEVQAKAADAVSLGAPRGQ